ncbi:MAG: chromate transporter [Rhodobacterales bacterium]|nr:MAG: chromate transporter [Rhodobacterales bacterium]
MTSLMQITRVFARIGALSFGGPAAQIALMHEELVTRRGWLTESQFLRALSFCMMLPGPEAMQLCTWCGWRLRGVPGGLIAGTLFVLPGAVVIALLAALYIRFEDLPAMQSLFRGVQATVLVVIAQAIMRLSRKALSSRLDIALAVGAFVALYALKLPFPVVIAAAALIGALTTRQADQTPPPAPARLSWRAPVILALLWAAPLIALWLAGSGFLLSLGLFFSKLAVVTFGGAYAVLSYMTQEVIQTHGWMTTPQMMDALGLAETTPGPLILVTQFVGHLAGAPFGQMMIAGLLTLWVTFIPCFLWIFVGAPFIDRLEHMPRLSGALHAITAAVVGVIASLSLWFATHVLFERMHPNVASLPDLTSLSLPVLGLTALAALLLVRRVPLPAVLVVTALASLALSGLSF